MTDPVVTPGQATLPPEIAQIIQAQVAEQVQARVGGFQRLISEREQANEALQAQLRELKVASLSPEEAAQFATNELESENARLRAKIEIGSLMAEFPAEAPYFSRLMDAPDTKSQLAVMAAFREALTKQALPPAPTDTPAPVPGSVDPNRPANLLQGASGAAGDGSGMDDARADLILQNYRGALRS